MRKLLFILATLTIITSLGCKKITPPRVLITVLDTCYKPVANATVTIYVKVNGGYLDPKEKIPSVSDKTNSEGQVRFEFKNEAIYNVKATTTNPYRIGEGMIYLQNNKEVEKTIIIR
ncbi:MAG: hypothetical protein N3A01_06665 [Bacteroidales bacterium]|nr:hypothetical protein [Bacteroidales bacterium]